MSKAVRGAVKIRPMTRSDIHDVLALEKKYDKMNSTLSYKDLAAMDPGGALDASFVADLDGVIVGFGIAHVAYVMSPFTGVCCLNSILVDPDCRHQGIGVKLLGRIVAYCQESGIGTIRTLIEEQNADLMRFVERLGFQRSTVLNYDKTFVS